MILSVVYTLPTPNTRSAIVLTCPSIQEHQSNCNITGCEHGREVERGSQRLIFTCHNDSYVVTNSNFNIFNIFRHFRILFPRRKLL